MSTVPETWLPEVGAVTEIVGAVLSIPNAELVTFVDAPPSSVALTFILPVGVSATSLVSNVMFHPPADVKSVPSVIQLNSSLLYSKTTLCTSSDALAETVMTLLKTSVATGNRMLAEGGCAQMFSNSDGPKYLVSLYVISPEISVSFLTIASKK